VTTDDAHTIRADLRELRDAVATVEKLQRDANHRLGKVEARIFELELWRARLQGAAATSRIAWLLAGGAVTGIVLEVSRNL
jgi:hypothetical protein